MSFLVTIAALANVLVESVGAGMFGYMYVTGKGAFAWVGTPPAHGDANDVKKREKTLL